MKVKVLKDYFEVGDELMKVQKEKIELQQKIDKAIEYMKLATDNITEYLDIKEIKELLEILGDKANE